MNDFTENNPYIFTFMRVLYNLNARKIILTTFFLFFLFFTNSNKIFAQNSDVSTNIWTLPYKVCGEKLSNNTDINEVASDNVSINNLYSLSKNGLLESINIESRQINWKAELGSDSNSNIETNAESVFVASKSTTLDNTYNLRSISKLTGITRWQTDLKLEGNVILRADERNLKIFGKKYLAVFNPQNGQKQREIFYKDFMLGKSSDFDELVTNERDIDDLFIERDILNTSNKINTPEVTKIADNPEYLIVGDKFGNLASYGKPNGKKLWKIKTGGEITNIISLDGGRVLVSSLDNFLYLLSTKNGNSIWKRRLPFRITNKVLLNKEIILIVGPGSQTSFVIDLQNGKVLNKITLANENFFGNKFLIIGNDFVFATNNGLLFYSQKSC